MSVYDGTTGIANGLGGLWGDRPTGGGQWMFWQSAYRVRNRIRLARLKYALTRWESAAMIALTIIATPAVQILAAIQLLPDQVWVAVLLFGVAAETALILASMTDPDAGTAFVVPLLTRYFGVLELQDAAINDQVERALEYRSRMEGLLGGKDKASRGALLHTMSQVDNWLRGICRLAMRLDQFRDEARFQSDYKHRLFQRVESLDARENETRDAKVRRQLRTTSAGLRHQLRTIEELENLIERGALRLEHAVGALGTIYTQVTIFAARGMEADDAARLTGEISDEIRQVNAVLDAMDRVYDGPTNGSGDEIASGTGGL